MNIKLVNIKLVFYIGILALGSAAMAQPKPNRPLKAVAPIGPVAQYVPVDLNALANDKSTFAMPQSPNDSISFNLAQSVAQNNLFLHNAGWPGWQEDTKKYAAPYDLMSKAPTDTLPVVQVPVDDYSAVYVLASCENDPQYSNILSLRIGEKGAKSQSLSTLRDYEFTVPRQNQTGGANVMQALPGGVFLMRLPIDGAFAQDFSAFRTLDVEITKKIRLSITMPDTGRFQYRPLGLPSGVHLYGMTFERSPLRLSLSGTEPGNVFNEPQIPTFNLQLSGTEEWRAKKLTVSAKAVDYYGKTIEFPSATKVLLANTPSRLQLPVTNRGYYALTVTVADGDKIVLQRQTTFALLPKDTRKYRDQSPFGTYNFGDGGHYSPNDVNVTGPLYVKAGLRYGMFSDTTEDRARFGVVQGKEPTVKTNTDLSKLDDIIAKVKASGETPRTWLLFHEDAISSNNAKRPPDIFTGKHYQLNETEQAKLDKMMEIIRVTVPKVRAAFPNIKFSLANGMPQTMEEFLRAKIDPSLFDVLGNEVAAFQRLPESQPLDSVANNPSLWMEHKLLKAYGYSDKDVEQCFEIMYPSTNPGNLTLHDQANYVVRNIMHSLAWKVPVIRFNLIADVGDSYGGSNWGSSGLMFGLPDISPKPSYVATATMSQMLDGATFTRIIPTGATTVYAFEFTKKDGHFVTCVWTPNAPRNVQMQSTEKKLSVTDLMGNAKVLSAGNSGVRLIADASPIFVESAQPLAVQAGAPIADGLPQGKIFTISALDNSTQWQKLDTEDSELASYNFYQPRAAGVFAVQNIANFEGQKNVVEVKPLKPNTENWWIPQYTQLQLKQPTAIEGKPTHIGLMVNGNGGWGRIVFELEDAAGQRWSSLGAEMTGAPSQWVADWLSKEDYDKLKAAPDNSAGTSDWNSNDAWGRSVINFSGWRYMQFPLPGNYPGEGYHWPYTSQWRCLKADGSRGDYTVHYPLKFKKLAVISRAKVLYGTEEVAVQRPEIYLKDLSATYGDPDTVFWKPDTGQR